MTLVSVFQASKPSTSDLSVTTYLCTAFLLNIVVGNEVFIYFRADVTEYSRACRSRSFNDTNSRAANFITKQEDISDSFVVRYIWSTDPILRLFALLLQSRANHEYRWYHLWPGR